MQDVTLTASCDCRSQGLARACTIALGPAIAHTHPTDSHTRKDVVTSQLDNLSQTRSSSLRSACAESLGLFLAYYSSSASSPKNSDSAKDLAVQTWSGLLRTLCKLFPAMVAAVQQLAESAPGCLDMKSLQEPHSDVDGAADSEESAEVVLGVMAGKHHHISLCPPLLYHCCGCAVKRRRILVTITWTWCMAVLVHSVIIPIA